MTERPSAEVRDWGDSSENGDVGLSVISGHIKWFDVAKGFGFIVPDDGGPDILLHVTCLRRDGFSTALEGARLVCEVQRGDRGLQAFRVLSMDPSTAVHPSQLPPSRTHVQVIPQSDLLSGDRQVVQSHQGLRLPDMPRHRGGHLHPHGDAAPLRHDRTASGAGGADQVRQRRRRASWSRRSIPPRAPCSPPRTEDPREEAMATRRSLIIAAVAAAVVVSAGWFAMAGNLSRGVLHTSSGDHPIDIELAQTPDEREIGLMNREKLPGRPGHAVRVRRAAAGDDVDEEHADPARHAVHGRRMASSRTSRPTRSRCRSTRSLPAARSPTCWS